MAWSWTPDRRDDPELMDGHGLPEAEVAEAYGVLCRVNRHLGNLQAMNRELNRFLIEDQPTRRPLAVLDVGSGSGDIPSSIAKQLVRRGYQTHVVILDRDPTALALVDQGVLRGVRGDALRLPFANGSFDLVTAVKFAHHFAAEPLTQLISEMTRLARGRVLVLDIRRHWLAYWGFVAWSRVFTTNRLVRYDGPLSVLRSFTADELFDLASTFTDFAWVVRAYPGFQLALVGRRIGPIPISRGSNTQPES